MLAWIQRGRSMISTGAVALAACRPVTSVTYASARIAQSRRSATTSAAPVREIAGPGWTNLLAVVKATVQSTMDVLMHAA